MNAKQWYQRSSPMASLSTSSYFTTFTLLIFFLITSLASDPSSSFSFKRFSKHPIFESSTALYGDAKVSDNGSLVQLTIPWSSSAGRLMSKKPIKLLQGNPRKLASFSTYFSFSMSKDSGESGDGLAFFMVPGSFNGSVFDNGSFGLSLGKGKSKIRALAVEFDTSKDDKYGDMNDNHVGIDLSSFVSVRFTNVSDSNLVLNGGEKLQCWIDYEAASKQLEVRLNQYGQSRPVDSIVSCQIDLSKVWNEEEEVFVGLSSSNGGRTSSQTCSVYSWSFKLRLVPEWVHSEPLDPEVFAENNIKPVIEVHKRNDCVLRTLVAMVFGAAFGALGLFLVLCLWMRFGKTRPVVPVEFEVHKVSVDKVVKEVDGKK